jgi:hypothetical protein
LGVQKKEIKEDQKKVSAVVEKKTSRSAKKLW